MRRRGEGELAMASRVSGLFLALVFLAASVQGQAARPIVRIKAFGGSALPPGELLALQNLVQSGVAELDDWRIIDDAGQELALREAETAAALGESRVAAPLTADFILSGSILEIQGVLVFSLDLTKVLNGEKRSVSETVAGGSEAVLAARRLVRILFGAQAPAAPATLAPASGAAAGKTGPATPPADRDPAPNLAKVAGSWSGDKGIDRVSLFPDGRGVAILSSGASMRLKVTIEGSAVNVYQDQPNIPEFFRAPGIDLNQARQIASLARPARWIFSLTPGGDRLEGYKESVFVKAQAGSAPSVDNSYTRDAVWTRLSR